MALELATVDRMEVTNLDRNFNQAATLTAVHHVPTDSVAILDEGDEVQYTDFELGLVFFGRIIEIDRGYRDGEGVTYKCSDAWRTLAKEPAFAAGDSGNLSSRIVAKEGTDAETFLLGLIVTFQSENPGCLPAATNSVGFEAVELPLMDKGGETLDTWINDVLAYTEDMVAWIDPNGGVPRLVIRSLGDLTAQTLDIGAFDIKSIISGGDPLLVEGGAGSNLNKKYKEVRFEGCGEFTRHVDRLIEPLFIGLDASLFQYSIRYNIPEDWATARYIDADGNCSEATGVKFSVGWEGSDPQTFQGSLPILVDEDTGENYFLAEVHIGGVFLTLPPPSVFVQAWFTYTSYDGPAIFNKVSLDSKLDCEGMFLEQHDEYFIYNDPTGGMDQDNSADAQALVNNLFERKSVAPDKAGSITVHIKGTTPLDLGMTLANPPELAGARIRSLSFDFPRRNITLAVTDEPLRELSRTLRLKGRTDRQSGNNWYHAETPPASCFCDGPITAVDTEEGRTQRPAGGGGGGSGGDGGGDVPSEGWNCNQGFCDQQANGQHASQRACQDNCQEPTWKFVPCVGCMPADQFDFGPYATEAACAADNPDETGGEPCDNSVPGAPESPTSLDLKAGKTFSCIGCSGDDLPGGGGISQFAGFIKQVEVDAGGRVKSVICDTCQFDHCGTGFTGQVEFVSAVSVGCCSPPGSAPVSLGVGLLSFECGIFVGVFPPTP